VATIRKINQIKTADIFGIAQPFPKITAVVCYKQTLGTKQTGNYSVFFVPLPTVFRVAQIFGFPKISRIFTVPKTDSNFHRAIALH